MDTSRNSPIFRIGIRSISVFRSRGWLSRRASRYAGSAVGDDGLAEPPQGDREGIGKRGLGGDRVEIDAEVDDGLRDLRPDAANDAVGAHEAGGSDGLEKMLRHQRVHGRNAGD